MVQKLKLFFLMAAIATCLLATPASAFIVLYEDEMDDGAGWAKNETTTDNIVTHGYDYSADGIPEAPNTQGGNVATTGTKLEANVDGLVSSDALTIYPTGQSFSGNYQLRFDAWMNIEEPSGTSTEFMGGGIGYDGVTADIASGAQAIATSDGGSSNDWRAFKSPPQFFIPDPDMAAGTHQGADPYYADFLPAVSPPPAQGQDPNGLSTAGSPAFQWITWEFNVLGDDVSILIEKPNGDRLLIVEYDKTDTSDGSAGVNTDGNISIFYADFFDSANSTGFNFGIVDNVIVMTIPEPASMALFSLGSLGLVIRRRK